MSSWSVTSGCVFGPPIVQKKKKIYLSVDTTLMCILLDTHNMLQPITYGHLQVDYTLKSIEDYTIFASHF
jgi:hypothetical protein